MKAVWNEETIRQELARLDSKTGLEGAKLPIKFGKAVRTIGQFNIHKDGYCYFRFSNYYFKNFSWPEDEALDVIRHEYAHYMDYIIYGNIGHGLTWKKCCIRVGAIPTRFHDERYWHDKHVKENELERCYSLYSPGICIQHPKYGMGIVELVTGEGENKSIVVSFDSVGKKKLGLAWVVDNCRRCFK